MANRVLPQPAEPHSNVGRPSGSPPWVTSSRPRMPVGDLPILGNPRRARGVFARGLSTSFMK